MISTYKLDLPTKHVDRCEDLKKIPLISEECKIVSVSIKITNSTFDSQLNFTNIFFDRTVNFRNTIFGRNAYFNGATFIRNAYFSEARFSRKTDFSGAIFIRKADFSEAIFSKDARFRGAIFIRDAFFSKSTFHMKVGFSGATFSRNADFNEATFSMNAKFARATFSGNAYFSRATFSKSAIFNESTFSADSYFNRATFSSVYFSEAAFCFDSYFMGAIISTDAHFSGVTFGKNAYFSEASFGNAYFSRATFSRIAYFSEATFNLGAYFSGTNFAGDFITFKNTVFVKPESQEEACRRAKNILAKAGNRDEEEYHFYREMEAKRIQKGIRGNSGLGLGYLSLKTDTWSFWRFFSYDVLEWFFVQKIFGYGVHPVWLFGWWLGFVVVFAAIYLINGGIEQPDARQWYDYFWFSVATAATPGYALYKPVGMFKFMAGIEAILGTFMWAAFITTFARKFMR